ncbi:MAG: FAD-binding protein [Gaiellales bacterium]
MSTQARPTTLAEAAAFLADARARGANVRIGDELDPTGLDRILEHEAGDLTCTVEAGVRLSTLRGQLAHAGQRLSLDPPGDPTVGACVARGRSGPLRHRFGTPRDLVLGVTLVLGDGTIASSGGKVVKNVAGYDLAKLVCGSHGRLALIGRVSLRLHPLPAVGRTLVVETSDTARVAQTVLDSQLQPSAVDILHPGRVAVLFEGSARGVEAQLEAARRLVGGDAAGDEVWDESRARQAGAAGRIVFAPAELPRVLAAEPEALVRPSAGVAYVPRPVEATVSKQERRVLDALAQALDPAGVLR